MDDYEGWRQKCPRYQFGLEHLLQVRSIRLHIHDIESVVVAVKLDVAMCASYIPNFDDEEEEENFSLTATDFGHVLLFLPSLTGRTIEDEEDENFENKERP